MSNQKQEPNDADGGKPELELNKETLQDLDVEAVDADAVKGGWSIPSAGVLQSTSVAVGTQRPTEVPSAGMIGSRPSAAFQSY